MVSNVRVCEESETLRCLLERITTKYNVRINLADVGGIRKIDSKIEDIFRQYSYHNNSFCNYVKKDEALHSLCIKSKNALCRRITKPFFGKCYLGICELYYPVWFREQLIALICIGQFSTDLESSLEFVKARAEKYGLDPASCAREYLNSTKEIDFSIEELNRDVSVVCHFLALLYHNAILQRFVGDKLSDSVSTAANYYQDKAILSSAIEFINNNYSQNISLDIIAKNCYCNSAYLSYLFNKEMGMPITDYINKRKIEDAKKLYPHLLSITRSLWRQALTISYFSKVFKKMEGLSPKDYRRRKN